MKKMKLLAVAERMATAIEIMVAGKDPNINAPDGSFDVGLQLAREARIEFRRLTHTDSSAPPQVTTLSMADILNNMFKTAGEPIGDNELCLVRIGDSEYVFSDDVDHATILKMRGALPAGSLVRNRMTAETRAGLLGRNDVAIKRSNTPCECPSCVVLREAVRIAQRSN